MSNHTNCADTLSAISSQGSGSGATPFVLPDGRMIDPSGLARALASLSARQVKALGLTTSGISGLHGSISSASAALQSSLESRLRAATASTGSTLYSLTWKERITPALRSIYALRASAPRTTGRDCSGWQTPRARGDAGGQRWRDGHARNLEDQARMYGLMRGLTDSEVAARSVSTTFYRRLMGLPDAWDDCAPMATRSSRQRPKRSSAHTTQNA